MKANISECATCGEPHADVDVIESDGGFTYECPVTNLKTPMSVDDIKVMEMCRNDE